MVERLKLSSEGCLAKVKMKKGQFLIMTVGLQVHQTEVDYDQMICLIKVNSAGENGK